MGLGVPGAHVSKSSVRNVLRIKHYRVKVDKSCNFVGLTFISFVYGIYQSFPGLCLRLLMRVSYPEYAYGPY